MTADYWVGGAVMCLGVIMLLPEPIARLRRARRARRLRRFDGVPLVTPAPRVVLARAVTGAAR